MFIWLSVPNTRLISVSVCLSFDTYPVWRLYAALLRFLHLSLVYHGLHAVWCRCVLVQFGHSLAPQVAVSPPVSVRILPWTCHTPSGEDATLFLWAVWLLFPMKTEFHCLILFLIFELMSFSGI